MRTVVSKIIRYGIVLSVAVIGLREGGIRGTFYCLILLGIVLWLWYAVNDGLHSLANWLRPKQTTNVTNNFNTLNAENVELKGPAMKGQPISEENAGYIEVRHQRTK